jgi:tripartite-type tricarboxylate transporter receptor subunit TctC
MKFVQVLLAGALACGTAFAAHADDAANYPERSLTLVVPYPAGGVADQIARPLAQHLAKRLGQPVVVENRAGANGNIGSAYAARGRPADGYTLLLGSTSTLAVNPNLYASMGYDPLSDLKMVTLTHQMPNVLIANPGTPYKTVADLVEAARKDPGHIAYGSAGNGNSMHLAGVLFQQKSGTQLMHVPYQGAPPALNDVLAGQIPTMFINLPAIVEMEKAGRVRVLAVTDEKRSSVLPHVPTMAEAGVPGVVSTVWNGIVVAKDTPDAVVARLNKEIRAVLEMPEFREPLEAVGYEVLSSTPEEFDALLRKDHEAMRATIKQAGIRIE